LGGGEEWISGVLGGMVGVQCCASVPYPAVYYCLSHAEEIDMCLCLFGMHSWGRQTYIEKYRLNLESNHQYHKIRKCLDCGEEQVEYSTKEDYLNWLTLHPYVPFAPPIIRYPDWIEEVRQTEWKEYLSKHMHKEVIDASKDS
jgi:hypothetical protein